MAETGTRLVLIRHGESRAQEEGFLSGHDTCTGLSERGRQQATALRDRLMASGELSHVDALFTSILPRAIETAEIIAPALGEAQPQSECEFCEIHAGEAEGMAWAEVSEKYPRVGAPGDPFERRLPGGETWAEFYARAGARLRRIAHEHPGERVVVVCHGGIVGASFVALGDVSMISSIRFTGETLNTSITEWRFANNQGYGHAEGQGQWRLVRFNDAAHLAAL